MTVKVNIGNTFIQATLSNDPLEIGMELHNNLYICMLKYIYIYI